MDNATFKGTELDEAYKDACDASVPVSSEEKANAIVALAMTNKARYIVMSRPDKGDYIGVRVYPTSESAKAKKGKSAVR